MGYSGSFVAPLFCVRNGRFWVRVTLRVTVKGYTFEN
nr:MAG TPA: hypothetical protein [Caudoviricetes sp.]